MTLEDLQGYAGILIFWVIFCLIFHMVARVLAKEREIQIQIKFPKNKKWLKKIEPIYSIKESDSIHYTGYVISKHTLQWYPSILSQFILGVLFPWPAAIFKFGYVSNDTYNIDKNTMENMTSVEAEYEKICTERKELYERERVIWKERVDKEENKLKFLNKQYTEQYEK